METKPQPFQIDSSFSQLRANTLKLWEVFFNESKSPFDSYRLLIADLEDQIHRVGKEEWYPVSRELIHKVKTWIENNAYPENLLAKVEQNVNTAILKEVHSWPLENKPVFDPAWLQPNPLDSWWLKLKKITGRLSYAFKLSIYKSWKTLLVFSKNKHTPLILRYFVPTREFSGLYVSVPIVIQVRKHCLNLSRHLDETCLKLQDSLGSWDLSQKTPLDTFFKKLKSWIEVQKQLIHSIETAFNELNQKMSHQLHKEIEACKINFQYQYQLSSSGLLSPGWIKRRYVKRWRKLQRSLQLQKSAWAGFWELRKVEWKKDIVLQTMMFEACKLYEDMDNPYALRIGKPGRQLIQELNQTLTYMKEGLETSQSQNADINSKISELKHSGLPKFKRQINHFVNQIISVEIASPIQDNIEKMSALKALVTTPFKIVKLKRVKSGIPQSKEIEIHLFNTVVYQGLNKYGKNIQNTISDLNKNKSKFCESLLKLTDVLEFNLEVTTKIQSDSSSRQKELVKNILDGIHRIEAITVEIKTQILKEEEKWKQFSLNELNQFLNHLLKLQNQDQLFRHFLASSQSSLAERSNAYRIVLGKKFKRFRRRSFVTGTSSWNKISSWFSKAKKVSRLENKVDESAVGLNSYLRQTAKKINELPYIYKTVFKFSALDNERLYMERKKEAEKLSANFSAWEKGQLGATAIVGEKGSGLTSFLNIEMNRLKPQYKIFRLNARRGISDEKGLVNFFSELDITSQKLTLEALSQKIASVDEKIICIIEDFHLLFLRTLEGVALIEKLQTFISSTESKIFWIISCNIYSWKLQDPILQLGAAFKEVLHLEKLNNLELEKLIESRHSLTGFQLKFLTDTNKKGFWEKWKTETQDSLKKEFLKKLSNVSDGNISVAIFYWLKSIEEIEKEKLFIQFELALDKNLIYLLSPEQLFTLTALVQHVSLSPKEHSLIFRQDSGKSQVQLRKLADMGILYEQKERYELHFFLYRALIKILTEKHLLVND